MLKHPSTMRIIALPLTTARRAPIPGPLTYYHFQTPPPPEDAKRGGVVKWASKKASDLWAGFGKAKEGTWKVRARVVVFFVALILKRVLLSQLRTFRYGERLIDRIDFEELALKTIDPSLGPKVTKLSQSVSNSESDVGHDRESQEKNAGTSSGEERITVRLYPFLRPLCEPR